jgi:hypothetical protein
LEVPSNGTSVHNGSIASGSSRGFTDATIYAYLTAIQTTLRHHSL